MDMNLQKYLAFIKTVEYGSLTKAAERMNYSQSGISRMISDLEKEWQVSLLERSKSGVRLTSDGFKLLPYAKSLCSEYLKLQMQIDEINNLQSGMIRIGAFSSVATHWIPGIIQAFQKDYPGIDYEFFLGDYSEIEQWLLDGRIDCGFLRLPTDPQFDTIELEKERFLVVLPEDHPMAGCDVFPIEELGRYPLMQFEKSDKAEISEIFEQNSLSVPKVHFTTWNGHVILAMVESGLGISILPEMILKRTPYKIVAKKLSSPLYRTIAFALRSHKTAPLAVKKLIEYLKYRYPSQTESRPGRESGAASEEKKFVSP